MKAMKFLRQFGLELLIFILLFFACATSSGEEQAIYSIGFIIYGELLCLHIEIKADKDEKG